MIIEKINKNIINLFEIENKKYLDIFLENYLEFNNLKEIDNKIDNKNDKITYIYNTLVLDSIVQFYIIIKTIEANIKQENNIINDKSRDINLVDIGTGFGIPGIILAILYKTYKSKKQNSFNLNFYLIESNKRKCEFLNKLKSELDLEINIVNMDCKEYIRKINKKFELVISRAVFKMPTIIDIYKKYSNLFAFWLYSQNYQELLEKYKTKIELYFNIFKIYEYEINNNIYYTVVFLRK
ncbi:MAG: class I SAM-dependent methyltransferase [bacterium]|nr:class I SAM-dependent methyltransferase [bacterium]